MSTNHYFSESADAELDLREIEITLLGSKYQVYTSTAVFSPDHIDQGTQVLLSQLERVKPSGLILDVGCGWGVISLAVALAAPTSTVWAIDVNQKSLALTRLNAKKLNLTNINVCSPDEVPADLSFDEIWSNPPIRVGKDALHQLLTNWLHRLKPKGWARLVVQKNLGSDSLQKWLEKEFGEELTTERIDSVKGFRILKVTRN